MEKSLMNIWIKWYTTSARIRKFKESEIGVVLDNWSIYISKIVMWNLKSKGINVYFLPTYSPEFAAVELYFSVLKKYVLAVSTERPVNLKSEEAESMIKRCEQSIGESSVKICGGFRRERWAPPYLEQDFTCK